MGMPHLKTLADGIVPLNNNTHPNMTHRAHNRLNATWCEVLKYPIYSLQFLPHNFHIFGPLKALRSCMLMLDEYVQEVVLQWFRQQPQGIICGWDKLVHTSVGLLSNCLWWFLTTVEIASPINILKRVSAVHDSNLYTHTVHVNTAAAHINTRTE